MLTLDMKKSFKKIFKCFVVFINLSNFASVKPLIFMNYQIIHRYWRWWLSSGIL